MPAASKSAGGKVRKVAPKATPPPKLGRPLKLDPKNPDHLKQLRGLGELQCTQLECAAFFGVAFSTFQEFLNKPGMREIFEEGQGKGNITLRRLQWQHAKTNPGMAIFLGKVLLGQKDGRETQPAGGNIEPQKLIIEGGLPD